MDIQFPHDLENILPIEIETGEEIDENNFAMMDQINELMVDDTKINTTHEIIANEPLIGLNQTNEEDDIPVVSIRNINLFYSTTDEKVSTTSLRVDLNTFVSNVGGSLGLFIGFSVLGGFFFIYDFISSKA